MRSYWIVQMFGVLLLFLSLPEMLNGSLLALLTFILGCVMFGTPIVYELAKFGGESGMPSVW